MISIKTPQEIEIMGEGGRILHKVVSQLSAAAKIGVSLRQLDELAHRLMTAAGGKPAFLNYQPAWAKKPYPASICTSVNDVVVHGLPNNYKLREGDILKLDAGLLYKDFYTDTAITVAIGKISSEAEKLIKVTRECLRLAIEQCRTGKTTGDIGSVIFNHARENGLFVCKNLTGHGIGKNLHEEPTVYNEGLSGKGIELKTGMVIAIEPMLSLGTNQIKEVANEAIATKDGSLAAHFEETIAITDKEPRVLTSL